MSGDLPSSTMATPQRIPVQEYFKVRTPSMTVTITAENLALPQLSGPVPVPGNLVTIDPNPPPLGVSTPAEEATSPKVLSPMISPSFAATSTDAPTQRASGRDAGDLSERRGTDDTLRESLLSSSLLRKESSGSVVFSSPRRSSSKHADAMYGKLGAPPPIQPLEAEVSEARTAQGFALMSDEALESKDFTYWNKLRRAGTRTEIRRWHTYAPDTEEDTAFFGRPAGVDVPAEALVQGTYYTQGEEEVKPKEFKLPTRSYVAPPIWIRRTRRSGLCDVRC